VFAPSAISAAIFVNVKVWTGTASRDPSVNETRTGPASAAVPVPDTALEGAADNNPKPNADTATSAMRLRSVFVDICFLSISQDQEFPDLGLGD
jgi:hypothetical protein